MGILQPSTTFVNSKENEPHLQTNNSYMNQNIYSNNQFNNKEKEANQQHLVAKKQSHFMNSDISSYNTNVNFNSFNQYFPTFTNTQESANNQCVDFNYKYNPSFACSNSASVSSELNEPVLKNENIETKTLAFNNLSKMVDKMKSTGKNFKSEIKKANKTSSYLFSSNDELVHEKNDTLERDKESNEEETDDDEDEEDEDEVSGSDLDDSEEEDRYSKERKGNSAWNKSALSAPWIQPGNDSLYKHTS